MDTSLFAEADLAGMLLAGIISTAIGSWFAWPGMRFVRLIDMYELYKNRQRSIQAGAPLFVEYLTPPFRSLLFWLLLPAAANLLGWLWMDIRDPWLWIGIGLAEACLAWQLQLRRQARFAADWDAWLRLTHPGNACAIGSIRYANEHWKSSRDGFFVDVSLEHPDNPEPDRYFISFATARRYPIPKAYGRPIRIFFRQCATGGREIVGYQFLPIANLAFFGLKSIILMILSEVSRSELPDGKTGNGRLKRSPSDSPESG